MKITQLSARAAVALAILFRFEVERMLPLAAMREFACKTLRDDARRIEGQMQCGLMQIGKAFVLNQHLARRRLRQDARRGGWHQAAGADPLAQRVEHDEQNKIVRQRTRRQVKVTQC